MSNEMRILTVRQPWAWAIIHGGKDVENRVRNIAGDYRGPVAIHAGLADFEQHNMASRAHSSAHGSNVDTGIVFGGIIGVVELTDVHHWAWHYEPIGAGVTQITDRVCCGQWAERDVWHLTLARPRPLRTPIPFTGALGLRRLGPKIIEQIESNIA